MNAPLHVLHEDWQEQLAFDPWQDECLQFIPERMRSELKDLLICKNDIPVPWVKEMVEKLYKAAEETYKEDL